MNQVAAILKIRTGSNMARVMALLLLGTFSVTAAASTGVGIDCAKSGHKQVDDTDVVAPTLASRTSESELSSIVAVAADESAIETSEMAVEESEPDTDNAPVSHTQAPTISTRLPGVSDSSLPSFRQQMNRTDI